MSSRSINNRDGRYVQGGRTHQLADRMGWWERTNLARSDTDVTVTIQSKYHRRPDKMAFDVYGKASLMWLILQYNNIIDINEEFVTGATIILPTPSRARAELLNKSPDLTK